MLCNAASCICRLLELLAQAVVAPCTAPYVALWLSLMQEALQLSPQHAGTAALTLPLRAACTEAPTNPPVLPAAADMEGVRVGGAAEAAKLLLGSWQCVAAWLAAAETRGELFVCSKAALVCFSPLYQGVGVWGQVQFDVSS